MRLVEGAAERWADKRLPPQVALLRPELCEHFGSNDAIDEALEP